MANNLEKTTQQYEKQLHIALENWHKKVCAEGMDGLDKFHEKHFGHKFNMFSKKSPTSNFVLQN